MAVIDANVILRFLTQDHPEHSLRASALVAAVADGERSVTLPEAVLVEVVQVLSSRRLYNLARTDVRERIVDLLRLPGVRIARKLTYYRALDIFVEHPKLSLVDAICAGMAESESDSTVLSFDREFHRFASVTWEEP